MVAKMMARWMLIRHEYDIKVFYKPSQKHVMGNHLLGIDNAERLSRVEELFPYESLVMV